MDHEVATRLVGAEGQEALDLAAQYDDPSSLAAATALRKQFDTELAAAALELVALRRRARSKLGDHADQLYLTRSGLEQATRPRVAALRARAMVDAGISRVVDLTAGLGLDALALQSAGIAVRGIELDPVTATLASANLGHDVQIIDAQSVSVGDDETAFLDPARRTARGRTWQVADFTPPWDFVTGQLEQGAWAKLGPGLPLELIPSGCAAEWISDQGDLVEVQLRPGRARSAVLLREGFDTASDVIRIPASDDFPEVREVGEWIAEPDPAITRAGAAGTLAVEFDLGAVADGIAYLSGDNPTEHPGLSWFRILETLPMRERVLKSWVREHNVGTLEIKKRGIDVDPAALRKRLRPKGAESATLILTPTPAGAVALVVQRER